MVVRPRARMAASTSKLKLFDAHWQAQLVKRRGLGWSGAKQLLLLVEKLRDVAGAT